VHRLDDGLKVDAAAQEELDEPDALDVVEDRSSRASSPMIPRERQSRRRSSGSPV